MLKTLITAPARIGLGAVRVSLLVTARMLEVAGEVAEALISQRQEPAARNGGTPAAERAPGQEGSVAERKPAAPRPRPAPRRKPAPKRKPAAERRAPATERETPPPADATPPPPAATAPPPPEHVSSEPTLVEEVADPGAQDGAGAEVRVDAPWEGYDRLAAKEVIDRLSGANAAELAAVELYELSGRQRKSVLEAVQRELRRAQASG
jgi:hypothetical protein